MLPMEWLGLDMKIHNVFGTEFKGTIGKKLIASSWRGRAYVREYKIPRNPRTESQQEQRQALKLAVMAWRSLSQCQKEFYNRIAEDIPGYNLFVRRYIRAVRNRIEPELPLVIRWKIVDNEPVTDAVLIVRRKNKVLFVQTLDNTEGEIALIPSDAPYSFFLRAGPLEESVLCMESLLRTVDPAILESKRLGVGPLIFNRARKPML